MNKNVRVGNGAYVFSSTVVETQSSKILVKRDNGSGGAVEVTGIKRGLNTSGTLREMSKLVD